MIPTLKDYIKTKSARWYWIIMVLAIATIVVVYAIPENLYPLVYLRYFVVAIFVLYLPGYTLVKTLFPPKMPNKTSKGNIEKTERIALSFGLSLAIVPIVALLLNFTPWGIGLIPVVLCLFVFSLIFASIALIREFQVKLKANSAVRNVSLKMS